jgi:hypothetical protein
VNGNGNRQGETEGDRKIEAQRKGRKWEREGEGDFEKMKETSQKSTCNGVTMKSI